MNQLLNQIWAQKFNFLLVFFLIFTFSYAILFTLDWLPIAPNHTNGATASTSVNMLNVPTPPSDPATDTTEAIIATTTPRQVGHRSVVVATSNSNGPLPVLLSIPALNKKVLVLNPASRDITSLDANLLKGVIRHPDSAVLGQPGNVFILGHSSYLPKVINKNFQALNGVQNLKWGDAIILQSFDTVYTYQVVKVYQAKAEDITVTIAEVGQHLTLATCNVFGTKEDRYIIDADLVSTKPLGIISLRGLTLLDKIV